MTERALPVTILEPAGIDPELLDHSLSLRFDLGQFDPRITFTRNSTATYFGSDGLLKIAAANEPRIDHDPVTGECKGFLVEEARTNRLTYSEQFDNVSWTKLNATVTANAVVAPDGTLTADKLVENTSNAAHFLYQDTPSIAANTVSTGTVFAQLGERRYLQLRVTDPSNANNHVRAVFDLQTGTVTETMNVGVASGGVASIDPDGAGRYRCSVSGIPSTSPGIGTRLEIYLMSAPAGTAVYTGNGISGIYIWGAQLEANAFPTSYIPTPATFTSRNSTATYFDSTGVMLTAAINEPRYDHGLVNGQWVSKGLLLEGSATNLLKYSEQFDNAVWTKARSSIALNAIVAPDGTLTGDKLVEDAVYGSHYIYGVVALTSGTAYTYSVFVKAAERKITSITFFGTNGAFAVGAASFDLEAGTVLAKESSLTSASITKVGDGWFRVSATGMATATTSGNIGLHTIATDASYSYTGDGTSGIYIWGAQVEAGTQPTSYIKTEATTVTRAADVSSSSAVTRAADSAVMTGENFSSWYRQDEGTLLLKASLMNAGGVGQNNIVMIGSSSTVFYRLSGATSLRSYDGTNVISSDPVLSPNSPFSAALSYGAGSMVQVVNGANAKTSAFDGGFGVNMDISGTLSDRKANAHITRISYYPKALTNAKLQALTQ